jgi:hypothetical protein
MSRIVNTCKVHNTECFICSKLTGTFLQNIVVCPGGTYNIQKGSLRSDKQIHHLERFLQTFL